MHTSQLSQANAPKCPSGRLAGVGQSPRVPVAGSRRIRGDFPATAGGIHHPRPEEVLYGHPVRSFQGPGAENRYMGPHRGDFVETAPERYQDSKHTPRRAVGAASDGLPRCEQSDPVLKSDRPKGTSHVQQLGDW